MQHAISSARRAASRPFDIPNLEQDRERDLLARARSADPDSDSRAALTELWMSHGKLVAAIAAKYRRADIEHDDLINAGHLGLHTAIMRFDTERRDTRLASYAAIWIRCYIHDFIRRNAGPVRLPESKAHRQLAQSAPRLLADARKACEREGVDPTDGELHARVAHRVGLPADEVARGLRLIQGARASLHADGDDEGIGASLCDDAAPTDDDMNERLDHQRLRLRLRVLSGEVLGQRERDVFMARSMADTDQVPSLEYFAERFGISVARVHQIEVSARRKIAAAVSASGYESATADGVVSHLSQIRARRVIAVTRTAPPAACLLRAGAEAFALEGIGD